MNSSAALCAYLFTCTTLTYGWPAGWRRCRDDQFWFSITEECEPCGRICDPPGRHENDCPRRCPNYQIATTTTVAPNTTATLTNNIQEMQQTPEALQQKEGGGTGSDSTRSSSFPSVPVTLIAVLIVVVNAVLGCVMYKKRNSIKESPLLRQIFGKIKFPTTVVAKQPEDDPHELDHDQELQGMLPDQACGDVEPAP